MSAVQLQQIQDEIGQIGLPKVIKMYETKLLDSAENLKNQCIASLFNNEPLKQQLFELQETLQIIQRTLYSHVQWKNDFAIQINTALSAMSREIQGTETYANNQQQKEVTTRLSEDDMIQIGIKLGVLRDFAGQAIEQLKTRAQTVAAKLRQQHDRQAALGRRLLAIEQVLRYRDIVNQSRIKNKK